VLGVVIRKLKEQALRIEVTILIFKLTHRLLLLE